MSNPTLPLVRLGGVLGLAQLAPLATSVALAAIVARLGQAPFSAFMLVATINTTLFVAAAALLQALFIVGGRALGRDDPDAFAAAIAGARRLAFVGALVCTFASLAIGPALTALGIAPGLAGPAGRIGVAAAIGAPAGLAMALLRTRAALRGEAGRISAIYVAGGVATVALALLVREEGGDAAAIARAVAAVAWVQLAAAWLITGERARRSAPSAGAVADALRQLWSLGWAVALVVFLDSFALSVSSVIVARFWPADVATHSTALLLITAGLVLPLGLAQATLQLIAMATGRGDEQAAARVARSALRLSAGFGAATAIAGVVATALVPVGRFGALLVPAVALLAAQAVIVVAASALRSAGLVRAPLGYAVLGYVVLAVGGSLLFGPGLGLGTPGVWLGLVIGFGVTAAAVTVRTLRHFPAPADRHGGGAQLLPRLVQQKGASS